jgi:hypothetical protein
MKLRSHLVTVVLAVLLPMIIFAAIVVVMFGRQQRNDVEQGAVETARALINAVDETLNTSVKTLEALATSRALDGGGDLDLFHAEAGRILQSRPEWLAIVLFAPDGRQLLNTGQAPGTALHHRRGAGDVPDVASGRPRLRHRDAGRGRVLADPDDSSARCRRRRPHPGGGAHGVRPHAGPRDVADRGVNMHVPKPVNPGEFTAIVASLARSESAG